MTAAGSLLTNCYTMAEVATFATTAPVNSDTWTHLPILDAPRPVVEQAFDDAQIANNTGAASKKYPTVKRSALDFSTRVHTGNKAFDGASGDSDPTAPFLALALKSAFNVAPSAAFTGTTAASASGPGRTTPLKVASASNLAVGMGLMWNGEMAFIKGISSTDITLNRDFSGSPANGDVISGCFNYVTTIGDAVAYLYILAELGGHSWLLGPGQITGLKLSGLAAAAGLRWDMAYQGNTWAAGFAPSTFTPSAFTDDPVIAKAGQAYLNNTAICIAEGAVDFGMMKEWRPCAQGVEGRDGLETVGKGKPTATLKKFYSSDDWDKYVAGTTFELMIAHTVGSTATAKRRGAVGVYMPNCQLSLTEDGVQNLVAEAVTIEALNPQDPGSAVASYTSLTSPVYLAVSGGR